MKSIYIHIPFCKKICTYCDFCKIYYNEKDSSRYLKALNEEIDEYYLNEEIETMYIGGGTPSALNMGEVDHLFNILKVINKKSNCEVTYECNPEDITKKLIDKLHSYGVNRISMGVQSFNKNKLLFMGRESIYKDLKEKINLIKECGINNISLDLMYGIPGESLDDLKKDVKLFLKLKPEHISTYSLQIEDGTIAKINGAKNIDETLEYEMYTYIVKKLKQKKYNNYEISNFSKEGYESKHNLAYWNNNEYYGFGLGASGYVNGFRYENTKNINTYCNNEYRKEASLLSLSEKMDYEIMLGLRKKEGINLKDFFLKYDINMQDKYPVKALLKNKDLIHKNGYIFINPKRIYTMNEILLKLI